MTATNPVSGELRLALDAISVRENVRDLDDAHVDSLAQSIALRGLLVGPVKGGERVSPAITTPRCRGRLRP